MDFPTVLNLLRSGLGLAGSALVTSGYLTSDQSVAIVGGVVAVIGVVWSLVHHKVTAAKVAALQAMK